MFPGNEWTSRRLYRTDDEWAGKRGNSMFMGVPIASRSRHLAPAQHAGTCRIAQMRFFSHMRRTSFLATGNDNDRADAIRGIHDVLRHIDLGDKRSMEGFSIDGASGALKRRGRFLRPASS